MSSIPAITAVCAAAYLLLEEDEHHRNRRCWVRDWFANREKLGFYANLLPALRNRDADLYENFVRMSGEDFDFLLELVTPLIQKQDTILRKSISAGGRLALTLRYLATGESFSSLQYLFKISQSSISSIIPEVCEAIYKVLKETYMKVSANKI